MSDDEDYPALKRQKKVHYGGLDERLREESSSTKDAITLGMEAGNINMSTGRDKNHHSTWHVKKS